MKKQISILTEPKTFQFKKYGKVMSLISLTPKDSNTVITYADKSGKVMETSFKTNNPINVLVKNY